MITRWRAARDAWPAFTMDEARFAAWIAERAGDASPIEHSADLYLACACASGEPAAVAAFEQAFVHDLTIVLKRHRVTGDAADELLQELRGRLFVGARPRIADYAGTGSLRAWVRAIVVRMIVDRVRSQTRERRQRDAVERFAEIHGIVERSSGASELAPHVKAAFDAAVAELADADRLVLRLYYVDGLSTAKIAELQGVHGVTVLRRLERASVAIERGVRRRLCAELGLTPTQAQSVVREVRDQLVLTLPRLLG